MSTSNKNSKKNNQYNIKDLLAVREALDLLDNHQTEEAKKICERVLKHDPNLVYANNAMGLCALHDEQHQLAETYFKKAIKQDPKNHEYITSLGNAIFRQGKIQESIVLFNEALSIADDFLPARLGLAEALREKNNPDETIAFFEDAVRRSPDIPGPYSHLGKAYIDANRYDEAIKALLKSLQIKINFSPAHTHLGMAFREMNMLNESLECMKTAVILDPEDIFANTELAETYIKLHEYDEAKKIFEHIVEVAPTDPNSYSRLASHLYDFYDKYDEAMALFHKGLELDPKHAITYNNIGAVKNEYGESADAIKYLKKALELKSNNYLSAQHNLALAQLQVGDFKEGWLNHECRLQVKERKKVYELIHQLFNIIPPWDGKTSLAGKSILLMHEQGFGDSIQFIRYAIPLTEQGAKVYVYARDGLVNLFKTLSDKVTIIRKSDPLPKCDYAYPLMSLPYALGLNSVEQIEPVQQYLSADPALISIWKEKIRQLTHDSPNLKVGIIWAGNPEHGNDRRRSIPIKTFAQLFSIPGVDFISIQKGELPLKQLEEEPLAKNVINLGEQFESFSDTAAAIECLDLVISVDTSVTHLSGALGHKTWTLIAHTSDWRWLLDRTDSPWYPSMRLFRQKVRNNWTLVLDEVASELIKLRDEKLVTQ